MAKVSADVNTIKTLLEHGPPPGVLDPISLYLVYLVYGSQKCRRQPVIFFLPRAPCM